MGLLWVVESSRLDPGRIGAVSLRFSRPVFFTEQTSSISKRYPSGIYIVSIENHRVQWEDSLFQRPLGHWMYLSPAEKSPMQVDMVPSIPPLKEPSPSNTKVKAIETGMTREGN